MYTERKEKKVDCSPLRVYYRLVSKDGSIFNLGYNEKNDEYLIYIEGFVNMQVNLNILQMSKLLYQLGVVEFMNEDCSTEPCFLNRQELMAELEENNCSCEVADIKNNNILIYRRADDMEDFPADGVFFIGPFIPDYLLNEAPEPQNLLEQNDEEAFIRGYQAALSQFDSFIYEQRRRFNKPGELAEAMVNTKGAMVY
ncbi:MAG: hypothetical protein IJB61_01740 [Bacteroides sp]|nr:hypothetical protein [Bacteroides sp.]